MSTFNLKYKVKNAKGTVAIDIKKKYVLILNILDLRKTFDTIFEAIT